MKNRTAIASLVVLMTLTLLVAASAVPRMQETLRLVPSRYLGEFSILAPDKKKYGPFEREMVDVPMMEGEYEVQFGAGASFKFAVDNGEVQPTPSLHVLGRQLTLRTRDFTVDPGHYPGRYEVKGTPDTDGVQARAGVRKFELVQGAGNWALELGVHTIFRFDLAADGTLSRIHLGGVKSLEGIAADDLGTKLRLRTKPIQVIASEAAFEGRYTLGRSYGEDGKEYAAGDREFLVLPGVPHYSFQIGGNTNFRFDVTDDGEVTKIRDENGNSSEPARAEGTRLILQGATITIDPGGSLGDPHDAFVGSYRIRNVPDQNGQDRDSGVRQFRLLRDMKNFVVYLGQFTNFVFDVDRAGLVGEIRGYYQQPSTAAVAGGNTLRFRTTPLRVVPDDDSVPWQLLEVEKVRERGPRDFFVVPDILDYSLREYRTRTGRYARFGLAADGTPDPTHVTPGGVRFDLVALPALHDFSGATHWKFEIADPGQLCDGWYLDIWDHTTRYPNRQQGDVMLYFNDTVAGTLWRLEQVAEADSWHVRTRSDGINLKDHWMRTVGESLRVDKIPNGDPDPAGVRFVAERVGMDPSGLALVRIRGDRRGNGNPRWLTHDNATCTQTQQGLGRIYARPDASAATVFRARPQ